MSIKISKSNRSQFKDHQITDEHTFNDRRSFLKQLGFAGLGGSFITAPAQAISWFSNDEEDKKQQYTRKTLTFTQDPSPAKDQLTPESVVSSFNNFYEFGTKKSDPAEHAHTLTVNPWKLAIEGLVNKPFELGYDDLFAKFPLHERVYRLRCVETWSMVVPWVGIPLAELLKQADPNSKAKYVAFETLNRPSEMRGQKSRFSGGGIEYPYVEGLRLDEAMHPLTLLAVGLYDKELPKQNGAPIRLVVPWKYGFKSIKSLVSIKLTEKEPPTTWNISAPNEYGFYANVNPNVAHPRWSQAQERRITSGGLFGQEYIKTQLFNGYAEQVAPLYQGMDLSQYF